MDKIAAAILCIGLCFYSAYMAQIGLDADLLAACIAFLAAIKALV